MTASAALSFRIVRKQSVSSTTPAFDPSSLSASTMPHSPSSLPGQNSSSDGGIGASLLGPGGAMLMSGAPAAANTIANKQAVAGSSLYQACLTLRDRLYCVPGFGETYLDEFTVTTPLTSPGVNGPSDPLSLTASLPKTESPTSSSPAKPRPSNDPVTQLWQCFRLGAPVCALFNTLNPETALPLNHDTNRSNANACKAQVMRFIIALKEKLGWDPDEIFTVSQLYLDDTNGFVRVVRTINRLLDVFEERGLLNENKRKVEDEDLGEPSDDRAKVIRELLTTERKYVQDLEVLQSYARALAQNDILPSDTLHNLFGNLNKLVDVQRRFLICIEENVRRPADEQHFGHVFKTMEEDFTVYEPFCANYVSALELITLEAPNLVQLKHIPSAQECYLDPAYELPAFMIKPIQRICKYPLLLDQLLKKTSDNAPVYDELVEGLEVIRRITENVNETSRLQENVQLVKDLEWRVEDWKGHNIKTFGHLLLSNTFMVTKSDTEREYQVYLFEKILLCCKELVPTTGKKTFKNSSLLKQKGNAPVLPKDLRKSKTTLQLKGRIFINNLTGAFSNSKMSHILGAPSGQHALQVWWRGDVDQESFALKCKNEEQLKQWQNAINKLIDEVNLRRQQAAQYFSQTGVSPGFINMAGAGANGRRNTATSSHFPQTPLSEVPPLNPFGNAATLSCTESQASSYRYQELSDRDGYQETNSGRVTPLGGRFSQPVEQQERQLSLNHESRPRARTEDQDSSLMTQWRSHSPAMPPPLPRGLSYNTGAEQHQHLRKASSSRQLRQPAFPRIQTGPLRAPKSNGVDGGAVEYLDGSVDRYRGYANGAFPARPRGDSTASTMSRTTSNSGAPTRSRSSSNPQIYPLPPHLQGPAPPMPKGPFLQNLADHLKSSSNITGDKRFSSSSASTTSSGQSGQSRPQSSTTASSPINFSGSSSTASRIRGSNGSSHPTTRPSHSSGSQTPTVAPSSSAVKLLVHYYGDRFVVVVLSSISFVSLLEKVTKKVHIYAVKKPEGPLRIRYIDEDGDQVTMNDDDDVQMAFESAKANGAEIELVVA